MMNNLEEKTLKRGIYRSIILGYYIWEI